MTQSLEQLKKMARKILSEAVESNEPWNVNDMADTLIEQVWNARGEEEKEVLKDIIYHAKDSSYVDRVASERLATLTPKISNDREFTEEEEEIIRNY